MKAIIFDLDGTLVDSVPDLQKAAARMLEAHDKPVLSQAAIRSFVGNGIPKLIECISEASGLPLDADSQRSLIKEFIANYDTMLTDETEMFPGARDALEALHEKGMTLCLCTNKPLAQTRVILGTLGLDRLFTQVVGGDSLPQRKPAPEPLLATIDGFAPEDCLYVGDSEVDADTAEAAGVSFALYTEGYRKTPVSELPHAFSFSDYAALVAHVEGA